MELSREANLSDLFLARVAETPDAPAYRQFERDGWRDWTWGDVAREAGRWQEALRREGLKPGDRVALCLHNRVEWVLFDQAALGLGLVTVPLFFGDRPDNMAWCLNDAGARLLLLEDGGVWPALRDQTKTLERVVCVNGDVQGSTSPSGGDTHRTRSERASAFSPRGEVAHAGGAGDCAGGVPPDARVMRLCDWLPVEGGATARSPAAPTELATLVYTSGTTGRPKGVMLSHLNILSNVSASTRAIPAVVTDRFLSFLPLSHMFERTCGYYTAMWAGAQTVYARSISQLAEDIRTQRPTILISVPRIFERIWSRMQETMPEGTLKRRLFDAAVEVGWRRFNRTTTPRDRLLWPLLDPLVARKLNRRLGGRLRLVVVGGAALSPYLARIFVGLGLPVIQGYGLTETAPVLSANRMGDNDPASVGRALEGIELRCDEAGELLARGPNIMLGYWNNAAATAATIDAEGWLHTGDLAQIRTGRVYITGRVKDIIVLSNGEKVPPGDAEQAILKDQVFEQVMIIGEGRPKLGLLCVSRLDNLNELCARANRQLYDFPGYARICHIARVSEAWTVENGLLTPTLKLKRAEMHRRFAREIDEMYASSETCCRDAQGSAVAAGSAMP